MNKKPTIVLVIPDLKGNGAERVVLTLAAGFIQQGCEAHIVVFNNLIELGSDIATNLQIHKFTNHYRWIPRIMRGAILAPILDRFILNRCGTPDLILSNLLPVDRILCESRLNNVFLVIHNTISQELLKNIPAKQSNKLQHQLQNIYTKKPTISVSLGVREDLTKIFNITLESHQIYNPINIKLIQQLSNEYTPKLNNYIIHVGKFKPQKRHDILIRAYHKSNIKQPLVLVGKGPLKRDAENLVNQLGLSDKIIFVGFKSNPYPLIKNADLMVLSSEYEGLGMVITESLALNTPVISTDCDSGPREILPQRNLVPVNNIRLLSEKIADAASNTKQYQSGIDDNFLLEKPISRYLQLLHNSQQE